PDAESAGPRRAARPFSPAAQHPPSPAQATVSNEPSSSARQLRPASSVTSVPVGPTARAAVRPYGYQAAPERYAGGGDVDQRVLAP
ncbi:hypothetical protein PL81_39005, partial [Streptomyces sp. RSD-27]